MEETELKGGIFITPKDIMLLNNTTIQQARTEHQTLRDILKLKPKKLTVFAYCEYYKLRYKVVVSYLNPYR